MARILIACECSGRVRDAFTALGHEAWSCDLSPSETPGSHYQCDVMDVIGERWDLMIAHPPCTYLSRSGLHWNKRRPERAALTEDALKFVVSLMAAPIPRIVIENPIGCISTRVCKPSQIIQPYQFGEDASKATCLWIAGLPKLTPTRYVEPRWVCCGIPLPDAVGKYGCANCNGEGRPLPRWTNQTDGGQNRETPSEHRQADRSRTYQGIAAAMASQWSKYLPDSEIAQTVTGE